LETVKSLPDLLTGVKESTDNVGYVTFEKGTIAVKEKTLGTNVDGDEGPELPITVEILPAHLTVYAGEVND
jgi:diacylglycerol kinase family enzyme